MIVRRQGNFGFVDAGNAGLFTFSTAGKGWDTPSMANFSNTGRFRKSMNIHGYDIVPMGDNNCLPQRVAELLDNFYAGEGILGKIQGLQYGQGPKTYTETFTDNQLVRTWANAPKNEQDWLDRINIEKYSQRCLTDLTHMQGFFWRGYLDRGHRIGRPRFINRVEHIPYQKCRLVYPREGEDEPPGILVGDWPHPDPEKLAYYPMFDSNDPFKHNVFMGYENVYSFCKDFISMPRFLGAFDWIELAGTIAKLLMAYNTNASALSLHIESPEAYWDEKEEKLKEHCRAKGITYTKELLDEYKENAFVEFTAGLTGQKNVGNFLHTQTIYDDVANDFVGWKVVPIDKKIKEYVDAEISIVNKANEAATSSFGLDPALANLVLDGKLSSGSEKLYSLKVYNVSETAIPESVLFGNFNKIRKANFGTENKTGFYRMVVNAESNVSPSNRMKDVI